MANIKGKQLTDSLSVTNVTGSNVSASGLIIGNSGSLQHIDVSGDISSSANITGNILNVNTRVKAIGSSLEFAGNTLDFVDGSSAGRLFKGTAGGSFEAYYNGQKKIETTAGGILVGSGSISGNITASGDISSSATASFGELEIGNGGDIVLTEDQRIYFEADKATYIESHAADSFRVVVNDKQMLLLDEDTGDRAVFGNGTKVFIGANNNFTPSASLHIAGNLWVSGSDAQGGAHVTASGNISSSATITSENSIVKNDLTVGGNLDIADTIFHTGDSNTKIRFPDVDTISFHTSGEERLRISTGGHITASGNISSSATITANEFNGIFNGALSGSAQIATDISGSFVAPSASFSTRVTTAETELENTLVSSSAQISTDISGSFVAPSSSFSTRITTAESELGNTLLSGSAQIATDISGSLSAAAIVGLGAGVISASAMVDHDSTTNFVANEHINHTSVDITAGAGLTGGGDISSTRTLAVGQGTGVTVNANDVAIGQAVATDSNVQFANITGSNISGSASGSFANIDAAHIKATNVHGTILTATQATIDHDSLANFVANEHIDHSGVTITAGAGLTGGGTIASTRTLAVGEGTGVTVNANDVAIGQDVATNANVQFATITTTGNITAQGDIIAENYIVSSSVTHMTSSAISGSSIFGDTQDDTHQFTGSMFVSGSTYNIDSIGSVSSSASGSFLNIDVTDNLTVERLKAGSADIDGGVTIDNITIDGTEIDLSSGNLTLDVEGNIILDANGAQIRLEDDGTEFGRFSRVSSDLVIKSMGNNNDIIFKGIDDSSTITALTLDMSDAGKAIFESSISSSASGSFLNVDVTDNLGVTGKLTLPNITDVSASIAAAVAGGDDMGNHTATQDLDMDGNDIFDVQHISGSGNISGSLGNILGYKSGSFQQLDANVVSASSVQATNLTGLVGTATQGTIDHDSLANFVANEHVDHTSITLTAGDGLSGGGTIASNRSFAVDATVLRTTGDSVISSSAQLADDISGSFSTAAVVGLGAGIISGSSSNSSLTTAIVGEGAGILSGSAQIADDVSGSLSAAAIVGLGAGVISASAMVDHDSTTNFVANEHINHTSVSITAGDGLTGGGTIASTRTLAVGQGTGVTVNANDIAIGQAVETDSNVQFANITATATASLAKISGSLIESTGDFTLDSSGDIILDADGTDIILKDGGTSFGSFKRASSDFIIKAETADKDILFKGTDDSTTITALQLDMSEGGNAQFLGNISGSQIEASGDVIAFGSSDRNLKDNIQPIENPLEKMDKIGGYTFVWNDKQSTYKGKDIGVVAQEIQEIMPEIVATRANGYLGVKYEKIVPLLIESIKELKKEVEDIKQKCDCLNK